MEDGGGSNWTLKEGKEVTGLSRGLPLPQCMAGRWGDLEMAHSVISVFTQSSPVHCNMQVSLVSPLERSTDCIRWPLVLSSGMCRPY